MMVSTAAGGGTAHGPGESVAAVGGIVQAIEGDIGAFTEFLATDPIPSILLLTGVVITGVTVSVLVYLALGAALDGLLSPALR